MDSSRPHRVRSTVAAVALAAVVIAACPAHGASDDATPPPLAVPFVAQTGVLCGGASLAMVFRYWGAREVRAEDFAPLVRSGEAGIRTDALVEAAQERGWPAFPMVQAEAAVRMHLAAGRPMIVLIDGGADRYHYVVLLSWGRDRVVLHDPAVAPDRILDGEEFSAAWERGGSWALLILPPIRREFGVPAATALQAPGPSLPIDPECRDLIEAGVALAHDGALRAAEVNFLAAQVRCPTAAAPVRELAGLRFQESDWPAARHLAKRALLLEPTDEHARRLHAASCFLAGDPGAALQSWNELSEPRLDLTRVEGLDRIRHAVVTAQLGLRPGRLLTRDAFLRGQRRLAELPALEGSRLLLKPAAGGVTDVTATLIERRGPLSSRHDALRLGFVAVFERRVTFKLPSPIGIGELWTLRGGWEDNRPGLSLLVTIPAALGRPGVWSLGGSWQRETYAVSAPSAAGAKTLRSTRAEERRTLTVSFADWIAPGGRVALAAAIDRWKRSEPYLALSTTLETRWARDRLALGMRAEEWRPLREGVPFRSAGTSGVWSSAGLDRREAWLAHLGCEHASADAPRSLWTGGGTGRAREPLLRAHPLLAHGVIRSRGFGRTLVHATLERQLWPWHLGPIRVGCALFLDTAGSWSGADGDSDRMPWQLDAGAGLRLATLSHLGQLRLDVAHGAQDGTTAASVGWRVH